VFGPDVALFAQESSIKRVVYTILTQGRSSAANHWRAQIKHHPAEQQKHMSGGLAKDYQRITQKNKQGIIFCIQEIIPVFRTINIDWIDIFITFYPKVLFKTT